MSLPSRWNLFPMTNSGQLDEVCSSGVGPDDVGIAAGISVGNMAGQSLGRVKHPRLPSKMIPDGNRI